MVLARVLTFALKPALATGAAAALTAGGWFAFSTYTQDSPTTFERLQSAGQRLIVSEFGPDTDTIVAVDAADPASRDVIATIDHAPEYGVLASLSPDGERVAYAGLPPDTPDPNPGSPAVAAVIEASGDVVVLADDIDLVIAPVWSPDSASIVVRKNTSCEAAGLDCGEYPAGQFELLRLGLDGSRTTITSWRTAAVFPIGFSPDGATLYFATLSTSGTDLYRIAPDGSGEASMAHLSDQVARDWRLSPDGRQLAYSAAESGPTPAVVGRVLDLATGAVTDALAPDTLEAGPPSTGVARGEFNPAWKGDGALTVASLNLDGGSSALTVADGGIETEARAADRMDLPLSWAPDDAALVVRAVQGETPFEAGPSYVEIVAGNERRRLSDSSDVTIVGWLE